MKGETRRARGPLTLKSGCSRRVGPVEPRTERLDVGGLDRGAAPDAQARRGVAIGADVEGDALALEALHEAGGETRHRRVTPGEHVRIGDHEADAGVRVGGGIDRERRDLVLVIGSRNSSNSNRLVEVARDHGADSHLIDNETQVREEWLEGKRVVGISSGASAPEELVQRLVDFFRERGTTEVDALPAALGEPHLDEGMRFVLHVARRDAERVRGDEEGERAVAADARLAVAEIAIDIARRVLDLTGLERAEISDELVERDVERRLRVDRDLVFRERLARLLEDARRNCGDVLGRRALRCARRSDASVAAPG